ncbi:hypothetical protein NQ315_001576, partial [Exocentrus adspersus]
PVTSARLPAKLISILHPYKKKSTTTNDKNQYNISSSTAQVQNDSLSSDAFDQKLITAIRHGIEQSLDYIERNYEDMNDDCWLGVAMATAIIKDAYQNGTQVMDNSSLKLLRTSSEVLQKGLASSHRIRNWIADNVLDSNVWQRNINYKYNSLPALSMEPDLRTLEKVFAAAATYTDSDICLQNVVNETILNVPVKCYVRWDCWEEFYDYDKPASAYILTHKLLLLQLAKARKCLIPESVYEVKTKKLCSSIGAEVLNADYFDMLDEVFDLFLEQVLLCGYEGYTEFFKTKWLVYILKSQRETGCFPPFLGDRFKSRIKRNTNVLPDGCADHTTGLGVAVLALYYNFIIKGRLERVE